MIRRLALISAAAAGPLAGQDLRSACVDALADAPLQAGWCSEAALGLQAAQGDLALSHAGGTDLPGAASTLGNRVGSGPRLSASARLALVGFEAPDLRVAGSGPSPGLSAVGAAVQGALAVGLFRGFSPSPTMGGLLAVDLLASGSLLFPPGSLGYRGTELGYGIGARLGIFRESFTLPGVTLTATQRWIQGVDLDDVAGGSLSFGVATTSLRALVGKDLWGLGFLGGVGWDRSSSDGSAPLPGGGNVSFDGDASSRGLVFGGLSWSYFVVQLSGEIGWATGWSAPDELRGGGYNPSSGRIFGGVAVRLIY